VTQGDWKLCSRYRQHSRLTTLNIVFNVAFYLELHKAISLYLLILFFLSSKDGNILEYLDN
jgi:hypothetical protein